MILPETVSSQKPLPEFDEEVADAEVRHSMHLSGASLASGSIKSITGDIDLQKNESAPPLKEDVIRSQSIAVSQSLLSDNKALLLDL